jgi:hypothetical protein
MGNPGFSVRVFKFHRPVERAIAGTAIIGK